LFAIFSRYLTTFKKTVATKRKAPNESKGTEAEVEEVDVRISETVTITIKLASSSYTGSCSSLSYLFTKSGISKDFNDTTRELRLTLSAYNKGRGVGGKEKRNLGISTEEGKRPFPFAAYKYLEKVLFKSNKAEHVGAHVFFIIVWNCISCAEFVIGSTLTQSGGKVMLVCLMWVQLRLTLKVFGTLTILGICMPTMRTLTSALCLLCHDI